MLHRPSISTLFPYTTLFRSMIGGDRNVRVPGNQVEQFLDHGIEIANGFDLSLAQHFELRLVEHFRAASIQLRSEEHTSELQSPMYLVCRLLLEKKNKYKIYI